VIVSASIGISLYPDDGNNVETLLKNADLAMYQAKNQGKNNFQFYTESMSTTALDRLHLENELRKALERGEFELYYQPKVSVKSRELVGVEALIRWTRANLGVCSPADFIPLAEETGLILPIGEWVLRTACHQGKLWQAEGLRPLPISINISKRQFEQEQLAETVIEILQRTDFDPQLLELEITESMIMQNPEAVIAMLNKLKSYGVMVSIDDFGTGHSSLGELRRLPLDALKIDRSFITNVVSNGDDAVIARAIIAMAHSLKLKVIAEGVETEDQLEFLHGLSCDEAQGYLFSKPVPAQECAHLIAKPEGLV
jgi:EAL domain-containing protein (putative c-di-GMP-specific phosphodiesterase class I)